MMPLKMAAIGAITGLAAFAAGCASPSAQSPGVQSPGAWAHAFPGADSLRVETVTKGVQHIYAWQKEGPWASHVLVVDRAQCGPRLEVVHAGPPLTASAGVTDIARGTGGRKPALAAVNADFFAIPAGTPTGAQVSAGVVQVGPGRRPVFAVTDQGYWIDVASIDGVALHRTDSMRVGQVNRPRAGDAAHPAAGGLTMFTEWLGRPTTLDSSAITLAVRIVDGSAAAGSGVVTVISRAAGVALGRGRVALQGEATEPWLMRRAVGDTITWRVRVVPQHSAAAHGADRPAREATGAFPALLRDGSIVTDVGEVVRADFGPARHPRTAVGWSGNGDRLFLVVVDGRQAPYSDGMSLSELTTLFQRLGASDAINLDGGGSTTMVLNGRIVNRVSDKSGERAVGNAIVLRECAKQ